MPGAETHTTIGFFVGVILIALTHYFLGWFCIAATLSCAKSLFICLMIILLYAILPDCDHPISTITWSFIGLAIIGLGVGWYLGNNLLMIFSFGLIALTFVCAQWFPHRGFIHSITAGLIFSIPIYFLLSLPSALLAFACYYSHLASDGELLKFW